MMKFLNRLEDILIGSLLVGITLMVFLEVVLRFGFNMGLHWSQEVIMIMSGWFVMLGCSWNVREKAHICVDAMLDKMSVETRKWVVLFSIGVALVYCGLFLQSSWIYVGKLHMIGIKLDDLPIPKWVVMSGLLVGFTLLVLRLLELAWQVWKGEADGFHEHQESHFSDENDDSNLSAGDKA